MATPFIQERTRIPRGGQAGSGRLFPAPQPRVEANGFAMGRPKGEGVDPSHPPRALEPLQPFSRCRGGKGGIWPTRTLDEDVRGVEIKCRPGLSRMVQRAGAFPVVGRVRPR
jgi:hypothetical protein